MNKILLFSVILLTGCSQSLTLSTSDLVKSEGFIAASVAVYKKAEAKKMDEINQQRAEEAKAALEKAKQEAKAAEEIKAKAIEEEKIKAEAEAKAVEESKKIHTPSKYLRLFSADAGCGGCIHQEQILMGSDWIVKKGTEEQNQEDLKYHILKETIPSVKGHENAPQWDKYKAKMVPFWQLIEDGKVVKTQNGVMSLQQVYDFYTQMDLKGQHNNDKCTCENCKCGAGCMCGR